MKRTTIAKVFFIVLAVLPAVFLAALIARYGVDLIFWDEWEFATLFQNIAQGRFSLGELAAQQVESRMLFPRLVVFALSFFTQWDVRYEMAFSLVLLCITGLAIYRLGVVTGTGRGPAAGALAALSSLLIFSPIQSYNVFTGHQMVVFFPVTCLVLSIVILYAKRPGYPVRLALAALLCTIGTFSFSNAVINWIILAPLIVLAGLQGGEEKRTIRISVMLWAAIFLANAWLYYHNYRMPPREAAPAFTDIFIAPAVTAQYYCALLGSPAWYAGLAGALTAGSIVLVLWLGVTAYYTARCGRSVGELYRMAGWFTLAAYALISAGLITVGRIGWSMLNPLPPTRYTSFTLYLTVALLYSAAVLISSPAMDRARWLRTRSARYIAASLLCLFLFAQGKTYGAGMAEIRQMKADRLKGKACLTLMNVVWKEKELDARVYPHMKLKKATANYLDSLGFIDPPLAQTDRIDALTESARADGRYGYLSSVRRRGDGAYVLSGWAMLSGKERPADAVLLTYKTPDGGARIFDMCCELGKAGAYRNPFRASGLWEATVIRSKLPNGRITVEAWAFDAECGRAYPLRNDRVLDAAQ